jgi:hypothetical protein
MIVNTLFHGQQIPAPARPSLKGYIKYISIQQIMQLLMMMGSIACSEGDKLDAELLAGPLKLS